MGLRYEVLSNGPLYGSARSYSNFIPSLGLLLPVNTPQLPTPQVRHRQIQFRAALWVSHMPPIPRPSFARPTRHLLYPLRGMPVLAYNAPFDWQWPMTTMPFDFINARRLSQGMDRPTTFSAIGSNIGAVQENVQTPNFQQWNFGIQRGFGQVHVDDHRLCGHQDHACRLQDAISMLPFLVRAHKRTGIPMHPHLQPLFYGTDSNANYNALQVRFKHVCRAASTFRHRTFGRTAQECTSKLWQQQR